MAKLYAKAPDGSDALLSIVITGFTQSLQQNGWCKLPNGLIFQWGRFSAEGYGYRSITFPLRFPSSIYSATNANSQTYQANDWRGCCNLTTRTMSVGYESGSSWMAIGN